MPKVSKWLADAVENLMASKMPLMTVTATDYINPYIKSIRFEGNLSGLNFQLGYAIGLRVSDTEMRNYTASFSDTEEGILKITTHLHGTAPGSLFMDNLEIGNQIRITIPRGKKMYDECVERQLIFGDETSLGLACAFQPVLQQNNHQFQFYFELDKENENIPQLMGLENYTVFPKYRTFRTEHLIDDLPILQTSEWQTANFILTGNANSIQTFRKALKRYKISGKIYSQAYWAEGKSGL